MSRKFKNQSNQNFELILVDDGSTDETLIITKILKVTLITDTD